MSQLRVNFCRISFKPQTTMEQFLSNINFEGAVRLVIDPDVKIGERYGRIWRFSKPQIHDSFMIGQFGFTAEGTEQSVLYDEETKGYIQKTKDAKKLTYSLWAIDLESQILAFEVKPPDIRYQSFVGNFEAFLDKRPDVNLAIEKVFETREFMEWASNVSRVTKFTATLRPPNPTWSDNPENLYNQLLKDTNADTARVEFIKKDPQGSLNTEDGKTIRNLVDYGKVGYSTVIARGLKGKKTKLYDSRKKIPVETETVPKDISDEEKTKRIVGLIRKFNNEE